MLCLVLEGDAAHDGYRRPVIPTLRFYPSREATCELQGRYKRSIRIAATPSVSRIIIWTRHHAWNDKWKHLGNILRVPLIDEAASRVYVDFAVPL